MRPNRNAEETMGSKNFVEGKWQFSLTVVAPPATTPSKPYGLIAAGEAQNTNLCGNFVPVTIVDNRQSTASILFGGDKQRGLGVENAMKLWPNS